MAKVSVEYLVVKPGRFGARRYFWQPAKALRALGWRAQRVPDEWAAIADPAALEAAAIAKARGLNAEVAAWRRGEAAEAAPAAAHARLARPAGSFAAVIASYKASRFFLDKKPKTRQGYLKCLAVLEAWDLAAGRPPVRAISAKAVQALYDARRRTSLSFANSVIRMLSIVLEHARREGLITVNPADKPGLIGLAASGLVWPQAAVTLFVDAADALGLHSVGTAIAVNHWLGQRGSDILALRRGAVTRAENGDVLIRQGKTSAAVRLQLGMIEPLMQRVSEEIARQDKGATPLAAGTLRLIVNPATGAAYNEHTFRHDFARVRAAAAAATPSFEVDYLVPAGAGAEEGTTLATRRLKFKHLRHTAVVRLAEAGAETPLISAVTGHTVKSVNSIIERYLVRTSEMARQAFAKRLAKEKADG